jgi:type VI secretion system secreted protein VgrG
VRQGDYTVIDAEGGTHAGTFDGNGFASVAGVPMGTAKVLYGKDPSDPWEESSYFGKSPWPSKAGYGAHADAATRTPVGADSGPLAGAAGAVGGLQGALGNLGPMAGAASQAVSAVQAVQKGGAQALLAQAGQAALSQVAGKVPGGALALNAASVLQSGQSLLGQAKQAGQTALAQAAGNIPGGALALNAASALGNGKLPGIPALPALNLPDAAAAGAAKAVTQLSSRLKKPVL